MTSPVGLARKAVRFELSLYRSLYRWVARRPVAPPGSEPFGYAEAVTPLLWVFIVVSAIDIPVLHLVLPWRTAEIISFVVGVWGLTWMIGLLASLRVSPHTVSASELRVRYGTGIDIIVPWDAVAEVRSRRRDLPSSRTVHLDQTESGAVLQIGITSQTNVDVVLRQPTAVPVKGRTESISELRFFADDPRALVLRARELIAAGV